MIEQVPGDSETNEDHDKDCIEEGRVSVAQGKYRQRRWGVQGSYREEVLNYDYLRRKKIEITLIGW